MTTNPRDVEEATAPAAPVVTPRNPLPPTPDSYRLGDASSSATTPTRPSRKRVHSIDVEEANQIRMRDLRLYTPSTARSTTTEGPREFICLCTKAPKVPRPRNAFILYRQHYQGQVAARHPGLANPEISKLIGEQWREQPEEVKNSWKRLAEEEKIRHQRQYPDYRYQPRRGGKTTSGRPIAAAGEDSGHCPKCGGRYIATPRTPSTPFSAAAPLLSDPGSYMYPYTTPNPRVIETDHLRRGSASTATSVDAHGRRYTQGPPQHVGEESPATSSAAASPGGTVKRRRFHGPDIYVPGPPTGGYITADSHYHPPSSTAGPPPHVGYITAGPHPARYITADSRYYPPATMVSQPPTGLVTTEFRYHSPPLPAGQQVSATGYGSSPLRAAVPYNMPSYTSHPYTRSHPQPQPPPPPPPVAAAPRPSTSYQPVPTSVRSSSGFDESLRLPPLQTQITSVPGENSEAGSARTISDTSTPGRGVGLGISRGPSGTPGPPPSQQARSMILHRLNVLHSISPPLKPPSPGGPPFETRGPLIAIEGSIPSLRKTVASLVEKVLSVSDEYVVKTWVDGTPAQSVAGEASGKGSDDNENRKEVEAGLGKPAEVANPLAGYLVRMLRWHRTSEELVKYITSRPRRGTENGEGGKDTESGGGSPSSPDARLPVAVMADGYSLTVSDRYVDMLRVDDTYHPEDHWQWIATLWRGIVGADLTIYVVKAEETDVQGHNCVNFVNQAVAIVHLVEGRGMDERVERRLGFELIEWMRAGSFKAGFEIR
ncbi:hypothetical protein GGS23DRAFT_608268 [Durotheca rogersii]|uniref:uncharacterized protein n=1 Tax=Durotheca rogersii TaxID=419775 RepID=UPI00221F76D8|nr:uncharacterized protein GGS23DRAFT_608268 [Durotheca rogersii]KAI5854527.1 hypothetical protein GGS23DRAFT_608268 [Durotheca rogersii]